MGWVKVENLNEVIPSYPPIYYGIKSGFFSSNPTPIGQVKNIDTYNNQYIFRYGNVEKKYRPDQLQGKIYKSVFYDNNSNWGGRKIMTRKIMHKKSKREIKKKTLRRNTKKRKNIPKKYKLYIHYL